MEVIFGIFLFVMGVAMGSFVACQAWRIRLRDKSARSHCMNCDYSLKWYDNIPVLSWLFLRGKCRKCGKRIGWMEFLAEVILGVCFVVVGLFWSFVGVWDGVALGLFLALLTGLALLFIYDAKWGELPQVVLTFCVVCAMLWVALRLGLVVFAGEFSWGLVWNLVGALAVLPLLYFLMYKISHEKWVGSGDWILALPLALVLGDFWLGFFCLFGANLLGSVVMLPVMKLKKENTNMRIPFAPFLIVSFLVVFLCQEWLLSFVTL